MSKRNYDQNYPIWEKFPSFRSSKNMEARAAEARFFVTIGWVKSANGQNSWMTSLSYARDRAPKVLVNLPCSSLIVNFDWPNINYFFLQCNKMRVVGHRDGDNFYLVNPF